MTPPSEEEPAAGPASSPVAIPPVPDLAALRARFTADFVGGRIGQHHNTFQHRERVLRQLTAQARVRGH
ncbi:MAG TPA: hypothetical protein VEC11_14060 [Allosphingosinicella sp.]|nr:hypothetical protein [Allosphingosinicella sp.]